MTYSSGGSNNIENNNNQHQKTEDNQKRNSHFLTNDSIIDNNNDSTTLLDDNIIFSNNTDNDQLLLNNTTTSTTITKKKNNAGYILGLFFIFTVSIIWSASSVLVQYIYNNNNNNNNNTNSNENEHNNTKSSLTPFLVTYIGVSLFSILLIIDIVIQYIQYSIQYCYKCICCVCYCCYNKSDYAMYEELNIEYNDDSCNNSNTINDQSENSCDSSSRLVLRNNDSNHIIQESSTNKQYQQTSSQQQQQQQICTSKKEWNTIDYIKIAIQIVPVWFIGNWSYNGSLLLTSITSSTVLASTSCVFTYVFALYYKDELFTYSKLLGILISVIGSIITTLNDTNNDTTNDISTNMNNTNSTIIQSVLTNITSAMVTNITTTTTVSNNHDNIEKNNNTHQYAVWGDILGILSAIGYAGYAIQTRVLCPRDGDDDDDDDSNNDNIDNNINKNDTSTAVRPTTTTSARQQQQQQSKKKSNNKYNKTKFHMHIMLGYVGLLSCIFFSPIAIYQIVFSGRAYISYKLLITLIIKGLMDNVLSDYLWLRSIILTNATIATVGLGLTIPLAFISDLLITTSNNHNHKNVLQINSLIGALFVLFGFILVNIGSTSTENTNEHCIGCSTSATTTPGTSTEEEEVNVSNNINGIQNNTNNQSTHLISMSITNNNEVNDSLYTIVQQRQQE